MTEQIAEAMTLDQMAVFVAIAETGTFSGAAKKLQRSQSAVSYQIGNLEEQLELTLFRRTRRRPQLTEEGRAMLGEVRAVLESTARVRQRATSLVGGLEPVVRLSIDVLYPTARLAQHLSDFEEAFESIDVDLRIGALAQPLGQLERGEADVAVVSRPEGFESRLCAHAELIVVVSPEHELANCGRQLSDAQLRKQLHLVLSDDNPDSSAGEGRRWRLNDSVARRELLLAGSGWCRMPRHQVHDDLEAGRLVQLSTKRQGKRPTRVPLFAAHRSGASLGPGGQWWIGAL